MVCYVSLYQDDEPYLMCNVLLQMLSFNLLKLSFIVRLNGCKVKFIEEQDVAGFCGTKSSTLYTSWTT